MKKIIAILIASAISSTALASSGSLSDFFDKNPELKKSTALRIAITNQAEGTALTDGEMVTSGPEYMEAVKGVKDKMRENGYDYAVIAVRDIQSFCENDMADMYSLSPKDCELIKQYKED